MTTTAQVGCCDVCGKVNLCHRLDGLVLCIGCWLKGWARKAKQAA